MGKSILQMALASERYRQVITWSRRPLDIQHPKLISHVMDFERLPQTTPPLPADEVFLCLGTTLQQSGPTGYSKVDYQYTLDSARYAQRCGVNSALVVSSVGASNTSPTPYLRTKAKIENALMELGFPALHLFRPSVLVGKRVDSRPVEKFGAALARLFSPLMVGKFRKYRPIEATVVAKAMLRAASNDARGIFIHQSDAIAQQGAL